MNKHFRRVALLVYAFLAFLGKSMAFGGLPLAPYLEQRPELARDLLKCMFIATPVVFFIAGAAWVLGWGVA